MKKLFILFILMGITFFIHAQGTGPNHTKYWFYRYRLINEFMAKGLDNCGTPSGLSIPAGSAYHGSPCTDPSVDSTTRRSLDKPKESLHYGDGSSFLGYYIGVLATEHKLMVDRYIDPSIIAKNEEELYYAMMAFERLDKNAEKLIAPKQGTNCEDNYNGFFLRDDVDTTDFSKKLKRPYLLYNDPTKPKNFRKIVSDYSDNKDRSVSELVGNGDQVGQAFLSQDQITDLFVGFSLARKFMAGYNYHGYDYSVKAAEYTTKIMDRLSIHGYQITIPNDGGVVKFGGVEVQLNAYAIAKAAQRIEDNKWGKQIIPSGHWEDGITLASLNNVWSRANLPEGIGLYQLNWGSNTYNNAILSSLAAIGDSWEVGLVANQLVNTSIEVPFPCTSFGTHCDRVCIFNACGDICYPYMDVWNCPKTIPIEVWCYSNTLGTVLSDAAISSMALTHIPAYAGLGGSVIVGGTSIGASTGTASGTVAGATSSSGFVLGSTLAGGAALALALEVVPNINLCAPFKLPNFTINTTGLALSEYGWRFRTQLFPLLHKVLHDEGPYSYSPQSIADILNSAPCTGPHYKPVDDPYNQSNSEGAYGWYADNRFQKANFEADAGKDKQGANLGLDYMLLHNLYLIGHGSDNDYSEIGTYFDKMNILIENKTYTNSATVKAMESIESDNTIVSSGVNVVYKAGDIISLKTGFTVQAGANFRAVLGIDLDCRSNTTNRLGTMQDDRLVNTPFDTIAFKQYVSTSLTNTTAAYNDDMNEVQNKYAYQPIDEYNSKKSVRNILVNLYPNPAKDLLSVELVVTEAQQVSIEIKNEIGGTTTVPLLIDYAQAGKYQRSISISEIPTGMYYLYIKTAEGLSVSKFIKQ